MPGIPAEALKKIASQVLRDQVLISLVKGLYDRIATDASPVEFCLSKIGIIGSA